MFSHWLWGKKRNITDKNYKKNFVQNTISCNCLYFAYNFIITMLSLLFIETPLGTSVWKERESFWLMLFLRKKTIAKKLCKCFIFTNAKKSWAELIFNQHYFEYSHTFTFAHIHEHIHIHPFTSIVKIHLNLKTSNLHFYTHLVNLYQKNHKKSFYQKTTWKPCI